MGMRVGEPYAGGFTGNIDSFYININGDGTLFDFESIPLDVSSVQFVNDPKYVRENNGGDLTAQIVAPTFVTAVNFFVDGSATPISGSNIGGAGADTDWWRLYTPLAAGEHEISAEVQAYGNWYDVSDTGIVYSIDSPTAEYIIPQVGQTFRPNDKVVRVKVEDEFDQFKNMVVTINASPTTVLRDACTAQGEYLLCDVANLNLPEGTYTASTTTYTKANNRYDNLLSESFVIDGTAPTVADLDIENDIGGVVDNEVIASATAADNSAVESVNFYMTEPRISDGACTGNGTKLAEERVFTTDGDGRYRTTLDVSAFADGDYCVTAQSRDEGNSNSSLIHEKVTIEHVVPDTTPPNVPTHVSPADGSVLSSSALTMVDWTDETDPSSPVTYIYQSSLSSTTNIDGSFETPAYTSGPLSVSQINTPGTPEGTYYWHVRSVDDEGNMSDWSTAWTFKIDNTSPVACTTEDTSLIAHWRLDETGTGTTALDSTGNGNDGTYNGTSVSLDTASLVYDNPRSREFDGVDDYVSIPNDTSLQLSTGTVSTWIKTADAGSSYRSIFAKGNAYGLFLKDNVLISYDWGSATDRTTGVNLADNTWHHVFFPLPVVFQMEQKST